MPADTSPRLSARSLDRSRAEVRRPGYDRTRLKHGTVHLGIGAFARAHLAEYTDDVIDAGAPDWGIVGASLRRADQRDLLVPQDGLYTLIERAPERPGARIVGCLRDVIFVGDGDNRLLATMSDPSTRIVSLTITEKGYGHTPATGRLDELHPDIVHDLATPSAPRSAVGLIVEALARRRSAGLGPFTVLSCDNLPSNGRLLARLVDDFARLRDDTLATWIDRNGAFPSTMVDRIVPAATDDDRATALRLTGLADAAAVAHEPFRQWVIEDRFVDGARPPWERAGAEMVGDVAAHEHMKLRLLNAAHSALAYLGYLAGHATISEAVGDPVLRDYVQRLWRDEINPAVEMPAGVDAKDYVRRLLERFSNPAIQHRTWQIAMDGSQKLPQRLLATIGERDRRGQPYTLLALAVAAWMRYVGGVDETGQPIDVRDPLAGELRRVLDAAGSAPAARVAALLSVAQVFGAEPRSARFQQAITDAYQQLESGGARIAIEAAIRPNVGL